jgi:hypothetical protein
VGWSALKSVLIEDAAHLADGQYRKQEAKSEASADESDLFHDFNLFLGEHLN